MIEQVTNDNYLSQKPGVQLIKAGTYSMVNLAETLGQPNLKSQIIDVPLTKRQDAMQFGFFSMQQSEDFTFTYTYLEVKTVVRGKIIIRDMDHNKYIAEVGDVLIFTPETTVVFDGESDGDAVYVGHRLPEQLFLK